MPACQQTLKPLLDALRTHLIMPRLYSQAAHDALCDQALPNIVAPVLDHETGLLLEHCQLRRHPNYKDILTSLILQKVVSWAVSIDLPLRDLSSDVLFVYGP